MAEHKVILAGSELTESSSVAISGSTAAAGKPLSNLLTQFPQEVWRSSNLTTVYAEVDLGSAIAVYGAWLGYTNFRPPNSTQWRVRAATSQANLTAAPDYDSGTIYALAQSGYASTYATDWPYGTHAWLYSGGLTWTALATKRWWRIDLTDATHPDGYFQAGALRLLGAGWSPAIGPAYGARVPSEALTASWRRSHGGILFPQIVATPASEEFEWQNLTFDEAIALRALMRSRRSYKDLVAVWLNNEGNAEESVTHGFVRDWSGVQARAVSNEGVIYRASVTLETAGATS